MRSRQLIFLVPLLLAAVFAPQLSTGTEFHLKGVLLSKTSSSALVNNTVLREGEELDGIKILEIREGEIVVRRGSQQLTVWVGTRAHWDLATPYRAPVPTVQPAPALAANSYGPVQRGETLSQIAERHLSGDITRHQMTIALYDANPDAFEGNINRLREGAILQIPSVDTFDDRAIATAEVVRQTKSWREEIEAWLRPSVTAAPEVYGPVKRGQTLSGIAAKLSRDGTTMNQMMMALYETNPQAFDGNINLLQQGAMLQIPDEAALDRYSHAKATAAIMDQMQAWRQRNVQQQASIEPSPETDDSVLLSMRGLR